MCSIIGYTGKANAASVLVEGLRKMEYRGYDSVGISTLNTGRLVIKKGVGKVAEVTKSLGLKYMPGHQGIGHTRWATHGEIIDHNAHPHSACKANIVVVHNGVIENYNELKEELSNSGHIFKSQTDSEVIAHLLEHYCSQNNDARSSMMYTCHRLKGTFAFLDLFDDFTICGARYDEPLIVEISQDGYFISSDVLGFLNYTDNALFLENRDIVLLEGRDLSLINFDGEKIERLPTNIAWELADSDKAKYTHFALKEICEQNHSVFKSIQQKRGTVEAFCNILNEAKNVFITGSGSSFHAALLAKHILSKYSKIRVEAILSSEFQYSSDLLDENAILIAISQSGETADVLQSVKIAKEKKARVVSIVNVPTSSLARLSNCFLEVKCGPEVGVAATKSFTGQLSIVYWKAGTLSGNMAGISTNGHELSDGIEKTLLLETNIADIARKVKDANDIYILDRSLHFPVCLEGALKIKELEYIHAEGWLQENLNMDPWH